MFSPPQVASRILDLTGPQQQPSLLGHADELGFPNLLDSSLELTSLLQPSCASLYSTTPTTAPSPDALAAACGTDPVPANPTTPSLRSSVVAATSKILSRFLKLRQRHTSVDKNALSTAGMAEAHVASKGPFRRSTSAGEAGTSLSPSSAPIILAERQYSKSISCPGDTTRHPTTAPIAADTPTVPNATQTTTGNGTCEEQLTHVLGGTDVELAIEALQLACRAHECLWGHGEDTPSCSSSTWPTTATTSSNSSSSSSVPYNDCYASHADSCSSYDEGCGALWGGSDNEDPHDAAALYQRAMEAACCVSHPLLAMLVREAVHCYVHPEYGNPEAVLRQILQLATGRADDAEVPVSHVPTAVSVAGAVLSGAEEHEWVTAEVWEGALGAGCGDDGGWSVGSCRPAAASGAWVRGLGGVGRSGRYERLDAAELARESPKGVARGVGFVVDESGDSFPAVGSTVM